MFCNEQGLNYISFIIWNKEHKAKLKTETGFSELTVQSSERFAQIHLFEQKWIDLYQPLSSEFIQSLLKWKFILWTGIGNLFIVADRICEKCTMIWVAKISFWKNTHLSIIKKLPPLRRISISCFWAVVIHPLFSNGDLRNMFIILQLSWIFNSV